MEVREQNDLEVKWLGLTRYAEALEQQHRTFESLIASRQGAGPAREVLYLTEHWPVVTMGRHADSSNLLLSEQMLRARGVDLHRIERGGDVTYHGPGQLVAYPIIDMQRHRLGVKKYVELLEETVIRLIALQGIEGKRVEGASGVWIGESGPEERKIAAVGVKCSHFVTMHGIALNVNTDLSGFSLINPCGFTDRGVTSMQKETGRISDMETTARKFSEIFLSLLD